MNELHKNFHSIQINITPHTFAGLAKQNMAFHQGIMELCDNAIAAVPTGEKSLIFIGLAPGSAKDELLLVVADWGSGMGLTQLENALQLGSLPIGSNRLNEHGFGINNALASLTGGDRLWVLYTRPQRAATYLKIQGPFTPQMTVEEMDAPALPPGITLPWDNPSTVYCIHVPLTIAQSVQGRGGKATDLETLRSWLMEHLGVAYRGFLDLDSRTMEPSAKIIVAVGADAKAIPPIPVPISGPIVQRFTVEMDGQVIPVVYRYGSLDEDKRDHLVLGAKAKYYYQGNQPTQGVDIRLGKRVIATAQLSEIWRGPNGMPLARHNNYNDFMGEVLLPELPRGVLSTLNNKTNLNPNDSDWQNLFSLLAQYPPIAHPKAYTEKALQSRWISALLAVNPHDRVTDEMTVWPTGARIDVFDEGPDKRVIYELKATKGEPLHLYQLKMYWDGLVLDGVQPSEAVLIVPKYTSDLARMAELINTRLTPPAFSNGSPSLPYHFKLATHEEKCLA